MFIKKYLVVSFILSFIIVTKAQVTDTLNFSKFNFNWFVSINYGYQISGIKGEDFVSSNFTPLFNINAGKWLSPYFAFQISYKGFYFNYIEDEIKHHYNFLYGEALVNLNNIINPKNDVKNWNLLLHGGIGVFNNHLYSKSQICENIGIQNSYLLFSRLQLNLDISSVIGWRIYQGDTDILPGVSFGVIYLFN